LKSAAASGARISAMSPPGVPRWVSFSADRRQ